MATAKPLFFASAAEFGRWLERNHATATEVLVGFHRVHAGHPTLSWSESVDEALRFGWIDGVRRTIDDDRYMIRFTPRRPRSKWSALNRRKVKALIQAGRMAPAGLKAWVSRGPDSSYSSGALAPQHLKALRANRAAWADWNRRPPSYRRGVTAWIASAKKEETRAKRLAVLIASSVKGEVVPPFRYDRKK